MKINKTNFNSYIDVENLDIYESDAHLNSYRRERLTKYLKFVGFMKSQLQGEQTLRVAEVGSGSSALLYALENSGILEEGVGIEQSLSRFTFAENWKLDSGFSKVKNINTNFANANLPEDNFHYYIVVDNTFSYLYPENINYPNLLLNQAFQCLKKNGKLIMELNNYITFFHENEKEIRRDLPNSNPFSYSIHKKSYSYDDNILKSEATYIAENGKRKSKMELSYVYTPKKLKRILKENNFTNIEVYSDFNGQAFDEENSTKLVLLASKVT